MNLVIKRLIFYWAASLIAAIAGYYLLWAIMPNHYVYGTLMRMFEYHIAHPIRFLVIPCFFYGIIATIFAGRFSKKNVGGQISLTFFIILITIILSSPFGGMLWCYYDMKAGYFPAHWISRMLSNGFSMGLEVGWFIIAISIPYNVLGSITCYFLTKKGSELFQYK